jgi:hypothetical protein
VISGALEDGLRRELDYAGDLLVFKDAGSMAELCDLVDELIREAFGASDPLRACANRRATFRTWHLSEGLNSLLTTAWHIRYSPIGAASKSVV